MFPNYHENCPTSGEVIPREKDESRTVSFQSVLNEGGKSGSGELTVLFL